VIRSFTPAVSQFFNMLPSDRGRPITDLSSRISLSTLTKDVQTILASGETLERTISQDGGTTHYLARLAPYRGGGQKIEGVVLSFVDVTSLTQAEARQKTLIDELNHRVKNILAVVLAVGEQTYRTAPDARAFKQRFMERIRGMATSYELLSREKWNAAAIGELAKLQLEPFGLERVRLGAETIRLSPRQALSLGLVLHELATNAAKFGALSTGGRLELDWRQEGDDLVVTWAEIDGPPVKEPAEYGFGMNLVGRETSEALHGKADIRFAPDGLKVVLRFPREGRHG
jgi:two-component system CheB/CheR fusion protein